MNRIKHGAAPPTLEQTAAELMQRLGGAFHRARAGLPSVMRRDFDRGTLAPRHVQVINLLAIDGELAVTAIAGRLGVGLPAASQLVGELARERWVERREDQADRRRTIAALAPDRRRAVEKYCRSRAAPLLRVATRLGPAGRAAFLEGLKMLVEEMACEAREGGR